MMQGGQKILLVIKSTIFMRNELIKRLIKEKINYHKIPFNKSTNVRIKGKPIQNT